MRAFAVTLFLLAPGATMAQTYAHCLLDKLPGSANEAVTTAVVTTCLRAHPEGFYSIEKGSGRTWFSYSEPESCVMKKAEGTLNQRAAFLIASACRCLYSAGPFDKGEPCVERK